MKNGSLASRFPFFCSVWDLFVFLLFVEWISALWVTWKPTFLDAFLLLEQFSDTPEARETDDTQCGAADDVLHHY